MDLPPELQAARVAMREQAERFKALNAEERAQAYGIKNHRLSVAVMEALDRLVETLDVLCAMPQISRVRLIRLFAVITSARTMLDELVEQGASVDEDWPGTLQAIERFEVLAAEIRRLRADELH
jgi:hypothetical protein